MCFWIPIFSAFRSLLFIEYWIAIVSYYIFQIITSC